MNCLSNTLSTGNCQLLSLCSCHEHVDKSANGLFSRLAKKSAKKNFSIFMIRWEIKLFSSKIFIQLFWHKKIYKTDDYNDAKRIVVISLKKRIKKCFVFPRR